MRAVIYLPFVLSAVLVGLSRLVCRRTSPRRAAWSMTAAMVVLAGSAFGALGLLAWPLVARDSVVAHLGRWRPGAVNHGVPVPIVVSVAASLGLVVVSALVLVRVRRLHSEFAAISRMHAALASAGGGSVVVVDDPVPTAVAVPATPARRGRVLVSTALLEALDDEERAAALAHEHAHLAHAHRNFIVVTALAAAVNPMLGPVRDDVAFALERWADEDAAARTHPTIAARALTKTALAKLSLLQRQVAVAGAMHLGHLGVPERVAALLEPAVRRRRVEVVWLVAVVVVVAIGALGWATHDTERLFEALRTR